MRAMVIAAVLGGCCDTAIVGEEQPPPAGADAALDVIHELYQDAFDRERVEVSVRWVASIDGQNGGFATACADVWVVLEAGDRPSDTSLAHEAAHCYAGHIPRAGCAWCVDGSHSEEWIWGASQAPGDGGLEDDVNEVLATMGL